MDPQHLVQQISGGNLLHVNVNFSFLTLQQVLLELTNNLSTALSKIQTMEQVIDRNSLNEERFRYNSVPVNSFNKFQGGNIKT